MTDKHPYFDKDIIKELTFILKPWEKIVFAFFPTYVVIDDGLAVYYKNFRGKVYITKTEPLWTTESLSYPTINKDE